MQLKGDGRGSKLLKILGELEKSVSEDVKNNSKQQVALMTEAFVKEHQIGATSPLAKKAFDEACESTKQPLKETSRQIILLDKNQASFPVVAYKLASFA